MFGSPPSEGFKGLVNASEKPSRQETRRVGVAVVSFMLIGFDDRDDVFSTIERGANLQEFTYRLRHH